MYLGSLPQRVGRAVWYLAGWVRSPLQWLRARPDVPGLLNFSAQFPVPRYVFSSRRVRLRLQRSARLSRRPVGWKHLRCCSAQNTDRYQLQPRRRGTTIELRTSLGTSTSLFSRRFVQGSDDTPQTLKNSTRGNLRNE